MAAILPTIPEILPSTGFVTGVPGTLPFGVLPGAITGVSPIELSMVPLEQAPTGITPLAPPVTGITKQSFLQPTTKASFRTDAGAAIPGYFMLPIAAAPTAIIPSEEQGYSVLSAAVSGRAAPVAMAYQVPGAAAAVPHMMLPYPPVNPVTYLPVASSKEPEQLCGLATQNSPGKPNSAQLGKGSYGAVYRVKEDTSIMALKTFNYFSDPSLTEVMIGKSIVHPNVLTISKLYDWPSCKPNGQIGYTLPLGLYDASRLPQGESDGEAMIRKVFFDTLNGIYELHANNILHGDIKPQNIIVFGDHPSRQLIAKVSDLGLARNLDGSGTISSRKIFYTSWYRPPEFFAPMKPTHLTKAMDIWALGVTFVEMLITTSELTANNPIISRLTNGTIHDYAMLMLQENNPAAHQMIYNVLINREFLNHWINQAVGKVHQQRKQALTACLVSMLHPNPSERKDILSIIGNPYFSTEARLAKSPRLAPIPATVLLQAKLGVLDEGDISFYETIVKYLVSDVFLLLPPAYWFALVDTVYLVIAKNETLAPVDILIVAYDILKDLFGTYPGFEPYLKSGRDSKEWEVLYTEKKNIVYAYDGIIYRNYLYTESKTAADLAVAFRLTLTPEFYMDKKVNKVANYAKIPGKFLSIPKSSITSMIEVITIYRNISDAVITSEVNVHIDQHPPTLIDYRAVVRRVPPRARSTLDLAVGPPIRSAIPGAAAQAAISTPIKSVIPARPASLVYTGVPMASISAANYMATLANQARLGQAQGYPSAFYPRGL
jgi:serine/threonine protein kinase